MQAVAPLESRSVQSRIIRRLGEKVQEGSGIPHDTLPRREGINHFNQLARGRNDEPGVAFDLLLKLTGRPTGVSFENSKSLLPALTRLGIGHIGEGPKRHECGVFPPLEARQEAFIRADGTADKDGHPGIWQGLKRAVQDKSRRSLVRGMLGEKDNGPSEVWITQAGVRHEKRTGEIVSEFHGDAESGHARQCFREVGQELLFAGYNPVKAPRVEAILGKIDEARETLIAIDKEDRVLGVHIGDQKG
jgi:hypothetical protein